MRRILSVITVLLASNTAYALDPLLLELSWRQPEAVTLPGDYGIHVGGGGYGGWWTEQVNAFNHTSWADDATVELLGFAMTAAPRIVNDSFFPAINMRHGGDHSEGTGHQQSPIDPVGGYFPRLITYRDEPGHSGEEWRQRTAAAGWEVDLRVPVLSEFGMYGYTITDIQRIVTPERQTIRFYGVVPEPTTAIMAIFLILHVSTQRLRSVGFARP
jgi:hypothetical protein